jgi:hypothetical protein
MIEIITEIQFVAQTFRPDGLREILMKASAEWGWLENPPTETQVRELLKGAAQGHVASLTQSHSGLSVSLPSPPDPFGVLSWSSASDRPCLARDVHKETVATAMEILGSPISWATSEQAWRNFSWRLGPKSEGARVLFTVRGIQEGLKGPFWRMWFREPYLSFLSLKRNGETVYFVELYEDPAAWQTPAAIEAARKFRDQTCEEAFYDPEQPDRKLSAPEF